MITPARNEELALPRLAECITKQTVKPNAWLIIDDGSTDNTPKIIKKLCNRFPWIYYIRLETNDQDKSSIRDFELHFSSAVKLGFEYVINLCRGNQIYYDYIGKIDADMIIPSDHFESLMKRFQFFPKLGVAGGYVGDNSPIQTNIVYGGLYLLRRKCLEQIGEIPLEYDIDNVLQIKAIVRNWQARTFPDIKYELARKSTVRSIERQGFKGYVLRYSICIISWILLRNIIMLQFHNVIAFLLGYLGAFLRRERRVKDLDIINFYHHIYPKMLRYSLLQAVTKKMNKSP